MRSKASRIVSFSIFAMITASFIASGQYTVTGYNNATWAGGGGIVTNSSGYLPMTTSTCPKDTLMKYVAAYQDKIFNGCLDECAGDPNMWGHGLATVFDFKTGQAGVGIIYSNLHHTGIWVKAATPYPNNLVFWIKGSVGGEQAKVSVRIELSTTARTVAFRMPIVVDTTWKQVVMPWADFKVPSSPNPVGVVFTVTTLAAGAVLFYIDQAFVSNRIPPATEVQQSFVPRIHSNTNQTTSIVLGTPDNILPSLVNSSAVFDFTGRQVAVQRNENTTPSFKAYIIERNSAGR